MARPIGEGEADGCEVEEASLEAQVSGIWAELLELDKVGLEDNFFALGGQSILAAKLVRSVQEKMDVRIPAKALFEAPTVRELSDEIRKAEKRKVKFVELPKEQIITLPKDRVVLPLKPAGDKSIFLIHPFGGGLSLYHSLIAALPEHIGIFGVHGFADAMEGTETISDICRIYVENIRREKSDGPYHILGWSFGSLLATDIARQLTEAGSEVGSVSLVAPSSLRKGDRPSEVDLWKGFRQLYFYKDDDSEDGQVFDEEAIARLTSKPDYDNVLHDDIRKMFSIYRRHYLGHHYYDYPAYLGKVTLYNTVQDPQLDEETRAKEAALRHVVWPFSEVIDCAATHETVIQPPHVFVLRDHILKSLYPVPRHG